MSKWVNRKAFEKLQKEDKIIKEPELTDVDHAELDRLEKKREKAQKSSIKGWKTRRRKAFLKAMTKAEQGVILDGQLVKGFVVYGINIAKAGLDYIDVFNTTYHLNNPSHDAKKINVEFFLSDYLKIKKAKRKKSKAKNRTEEIGKEVIYMDTCNFCGKEFLNEEDKEKYFKGFTHKKCFKLFRQNSPRNSIRWEALEKAKQWEAKGIRKHLLSKGCKINLNPFIDVWYGQFRRLKRDTPDDVWERFLDNNRDGLNKKGVRKFLEQTKKRKKNKNRKRLENLILLYCNMYPCYHCMDYTILGYQRTATPVEKREVKAKEISHAECLKCGTTYKVTA